MNKTDAKPEPEGKPMTAADHRRWREGMGRWMDAPYRRAAKEGWSHDDYDDCC